MNKYCRVCNGILSDANWWASAKKIQSNICISCGRKLNSNRQKTIRGKEIHNTACLKYAKTEKGKITQSEQNKKYYEKNKERERKRVSIYFKTLSGKKVKRKIDSKRRKFGFNPLNTYFMNSEAHHIDINNVIYIPKELHKMIIHNNYNSKNMSIINTYAYFFLLQQNIRELNNIFRMER